MESIKHLDGHLPFDLTRNNHFDYYNKKVKEDREGLKEYPKSKFYNGKVNKLIPEGCFKGAYGYIITPQGAKDILNWTNNNDYFLLMDVLTIEQLTYSVLIVLM